MSRHLLTGCLTVSHPALFTSWQCQPASYCSFPRHRGVALTDPARVCVAALVWQVAPRSQGLFHRALMESGPFAQVVPGCLRVPVLAAGCIRTCAVLRAGKRNRNWRSAKH